MSGGNAAKLVVGVLALWLLAAADPAVSGPAPLAGPVDHGPDPASVDRLPELRLRPALSAAWCGTTRADDDLEHEVSNGTYKYHAIYAVPSDAPARFGLVAGRLQTDAFQASGLLERLYGRALRFDMGTSCGPGYLDISAVRLASTTAELQEAAASPQPWVFDRVVVDLRAAGFAVIPTSATRSRHPRSRRTSSSGSTGRHPPVCAARRTITTIRPAGRTTGTTSAASSRSSTSRRRVLRLEHGQPRDRSQPRRAPARCTERVRRGALQRRLRGHHVLPERRRAARPARRTRCSSTTATTTTGIRPAAPSPGWTVNLSRFVCPTVDCNGLPGGGAPIGRRRRRCGAGVGRLVPRDTRKHELRRDGRCARVRHGAARGHASRGGRSRATGGECGCECAAAAARGYASCAGSADGAARVVRVPATVTFRVRCDRRVTGQDARVRSKEQR